MKRIITLAAACLLALAIQAQNQTASSQFSITPQDAQKAAKTLLLANGQDSKSSIMLMNSPFADLHVFSLNGGSGFVILSTDCNTEPILGYSFKNPISFDDMPANLRLWLESYAATVRYNRDHPDLASSKQARSKWQRLIAGDQNAILSNEPKLIISPMLHTQWDQSPYYNKFCPFDSAAGKLSVSGCTATATAQIMKYYNHPAEGYGRGEYTHPRFGVIAADYGTYLWDSMPNALNNRSSETQVDAVATLIYHCGVAVHMGYSATGSGGKTASYGYGGDAASENAFKYNFKYSPYVWTAFRIDYNDNDWKDLMLEELKNHRPILYAGYDEQQGGHAFVIDGYKSMDATFSINWGWGGSADGFFPITGLNPGSYNFNLFATATIGITPFDRFGEATTVVNTAVEGINGAFDSDGIVTGSGTYHFGDTIVLTATANSPHIRFAQWSDGCRYNPRSTVATGGEVSFTAQFEPLTVDTIGYFTTGNAMNRAANIPEGLATDSVWGIKIDASAIKAGSILHAIRLQGRKQATHTLSIYSGTMAPETLLCEETFFDSLPYDYTFHTHNLNTPIHLDGTKSLWIKFKCTEVDTPAVFSIWGGNPNGMLVGDELQPREDWKFSWMIEALFENNLAIENCIETHHSAFEIYPNPAGNSVTISLTDNTPITRLLITDIYGRPIKTITDNRLIANTGLQNSNYTIDLNNLQTGIYFVKLESDSQTTVKKLVIKR